MNESVTVPSLASISLRLAEGSSRGFAPEPSQFAIGSIDFGGWQIHPVAADPCSFPGCDPYLVKVNYDVVLAADAPAPIWLEAGFEFVTEGVAVTDAIPHSIRAPADACWYSLTDRLTFALAPAGAHGGSVSAPGQALQHDIPMPAVDPVLEVFGIGGSRIRWRHASAAATHAGSQARWLALIVPAGRDELDVRAHAAYASTPHRLRGKEVLTAPESFAVRLPVGHRLPVGQARSAEPAPPPTLTMRMGFVVDVVGYSLRTEPGQYAIQQRLADLLATVMADLGIDLDANYLQGSGDGMNVFLPTDADLSQALPALLTAAGRRLSADNRRHGDRMRLRMAVDIGPVRLAAMGFSGKTIISFGRLVDSIPLREAITRQSDADLAVLVSDWLYDAVISQSYPGLDSSQFTRVHAVVKGFQADAWLWTSSPS